MRILKLTTVGTIIALFLSTLALTGCTGASSLERRVLWSGTSRSNEMAYKYATFTGTEEGNVLIRAGETVVLAYAATVNKGTLTIKVQTPSKATVWETTLSESVDEQQVKVTPLQGGDCAILVIGDDTGGDFAVSWSVQ